MDRRFIWQFPNPGPELSAEDVVKIQLEAIQNNDLVPDDAGIRVVFEYASPEHRRLFGPIERFIVMLKEPLFAAMIGFRQAELDAVRIIDEIARQRVRLYHEGRSIDTVFLLSRQHEEPFEGFWMTDSVLLES